MSEYNTKWADYQREFLTVSSLFIKIVKKKKNNHRNLKKQILIDLPRFTGFMSSDILCSPIYMKLLVYSNGMIQVIKKTKNKRKEKNLINDNWFPMTVRGRKIINYKNPKSKNIYWLHHKLVGKEKRWMDSHCPLITIFKKQRHNPPWTPHYIFLEKATLKYWEKKTTTKNAGTEILRCAIINVLSQIDL